MKKGILKTAILLLITGVLLLAMTATVSADDGDDGCPCTCGSQTWFLDGSNDSPVPGTRLMFKSASSVTPGAVTVDNGTCAVWCADQPAASDVTFPYGIWTIIIRTESDWGVFANDCSVDVGYVDANGVFTSFAIPYTFNCYFDHAEMIIEWQVQIGSKTVPQGKYLAVRVCNQDSVQHSILTTGDLCGGSQLRSPCSDPGYPTPELATGVLLGAGLVGLGGFAYVSSRKRKAIS